MIFFAAASGIGAPKVLIILLTSASQVGAGNGGCMVMYRVLWHIAQKLCVSARPSPSANSVAKEGKERSEEHTSELQSRLHLVCRLLLEKKKSAQPSSIRRSTPCDITRRTSGLSTGASVLFTPSTWCAGSRSPSSSAVRNASGVLPWPCA